MFSVTAIMPIFSSMCSFNLRMCCCLLIKTLLIKNNKKSEAALKNEAGGDEEHVIFLLGLRCLYLLIIVGLR